MFQLQTMNGDVMYMYFSVKLQPIENKAFNFYRKNCMSIEIVKEDELQKVNFRVKNKVIFICIWVPIMDLLYPGNWELFL